MAGIFGTASAAADNTSYNSSPSHNFLTSVDDTLRADNLSPSSSQGSPASSDRNDRELTELKPSSASENYKELTKLKPPRAFGHDKELTELKPLMKPASNISFLDFPAASGGYSSFSSIQSDSSSPTYYNSLITPVAQASEKNSGPYTPTAQSSTYYSTMTTPTPVHSTYCPALKSASPNYYDASTSPTSSCPTYYSSMDGMTTPTSACPSYYSSMNRTIIPASSSPSYCSSLDGMTTPTSASPTYYSSLNGMTTPTSASPTYYSESHISPHTQHSKLSESQHHQNNTSPIADYTPTSNAYTAPKPRSVPVKPSSLQEMEEERSVSRARKQRTIFTEKQVRSIINYLALIKINSCEYHK